MIIGDWLAHRAQLTPNRVALIDTTGGARRPISYRAWNHAANRTATLLREQFGVRKGDRVAVLAMNCVEYLEIWFACGKLGAILQNLNWRLTPAELAVLLDDAAPNLLIYGPDFVAQAAALRALPCGVAHFAALDPAHACPGDRVFVPGDDVPSTPPPPVELAWDDPWLICYTGGTTGLPKGALLTHRAITWNAINTTTSWGLCADDVAILNAPLFHTGGLNVFTAPLVHIGGTSIVCRTFDCDQVYDLIDDAGVTLFFGVPTMFIALQQHPRWDAADFSRLKLIISGGAPCPLPVFERFWARGVDFKTGYGLTEAGPNTFWLPPEDVRRKPGAVGFPLMHIDVKIVAADQRECAADEPGELLIRGPHMCAGYWNRPADSAGAIVDGWLHTGDLARRDAEGYYWIVGRIKDVIISGGENIYPAEVENVLAAHPAVAAAALIGLPDATWGEVGCAVLVARPGPLPVFERFWARGVDFKTGYGLTEAGPNTFWLPPRDVRRKPGAVGFPLFHVDVKVVDKDGRECAADEHGELLIRGPHVCAGYWNRPAESAQAIVGGWLHTGDLARRDAEGYHWIVGRLKDVIISGGENIYPAEVENVIAAHPAVVEAALIGVPDARWGEVGRAIVVAGAALGADELIEFCRERLARYKIPKSVVFADALPRTGAGKVDKIELLRRYGGA